MIRISILLHICAACFATLNLGCHKKLCVEKENDSNTRVNACLCELTSVYVCKRSKGWLRAGMLLIGIVKAPLEQS